MASRAIWEDLYVFTQHKEGIAAAVPADTSTFNDPTLTGSIGATFITGYKGIDDDIYGIALNNRPEFDFGQTIVDTRKTFGTPFRHTGTVTGSQEDMEFQQSTRLPTTTWEFDCSYRNITPFLWAFFQDGTYEEDTTPFLKTAVPYATGDCQTWMTLCRRMSAAVADSHVFGGCIVRSLTLNSTFGEPLRASVEMIGYNGVSNFDWSAQSSLSNFDPVAPLMWEDATVRLTPQGDSATPINIPGFELTLNNNAVSKFYDSKFPDRFILGDLEITGSIQIPWGQTTEGGNNALIDFVNGTDAFLEIYWGNATPSAAGDFKIEVNCRYSNAVLAGDDETVTGLEFFGAADNVVTGSPSSFDPTDPDAVAGGHHAVKIYAADIVDRTISQGAFT